MIQFTLSYITKWIKKLFINQSRKFCEICDDKLTKFQIRLNIEQTHYICKFLIRIIKQVSHAIIVFESNKTIEIVLSLNFLMNTITVVSKMDLSLVLILGKFFEKFVLLLIIQRIVLFLIIKRLLKELDIITTEIFLAK